jgi:NhaA family Na+:H+ antiporter
MSSSTVEPLRPPSFLHRDGTLARIARPLSQFLRVEAGGGIVLVVAAIVALVWANSPWDASYESVWSTPIEVTVGSYRFDEDLRHVVNDGLMALFFLVVGLEIKRELVTGELRDRRQVALPALGAVGGMVVPALIFVAFNVGGPGRDGWGIPMATDIAFALGVMAILGRRVPAPLKVFVLTLAIADDIGAITVIAVFYSDGVQPWYLLSAAAVIAAIVGMRALKVTYPPVYVAAGASLWLLILESGVHATIAGVIMGLLTPATPLLTNLETEAIVDTLENRDQLSSDDILTTATAIRESVPTCDRLIGLLHPWTSYLIVPVFALANAGIPLNGDSLTGSPDVFAGVAVGLVVGKTVGITAFAWLATRVRAASLPSGVRWSELTAAAALAGIGFTVSLFITGLAFTDAVLEDAAKLGILVASVIAALVGSGLFLVVNRRDRDEPDSASPIARQPTPEPR